MKPVNKVDYDQSKSVRAFQPATVTTLIQAIPTLFTCIPYLSPPPPTGSFHCHCLPLTMLPLSNHLLSHPILCIICPRNSLYCTLKSQSLIWGCLDGPPGDPQATCSLATVDIPLSKCNYNMSCLFLDCCTRNVMVY